jgi:hypothetical protein
VDGFYSRSNQSVIDEICGYNWTGLTQHELLNVARVYYYFSIQFRENLRVARRLHPTDANLLRLEEGECNTSNLSPWPSVADEGEVMDHDEFMRRALKLASGHNPEDPRLIAAGERYLRTCRAMAPEARAQSIASYENGGLESLFRAILKCQNWNEPALQAFRHFLVKHIEFDSDMENGHGALSRQLQPEDRFVVPLWCAFSEILVEAAPSLLNEEPSQSRS